MFFNKKIKQTKIQKFTLSDNAILFIKKVLYKTKKGTTFAP